MYENLISELDNFDDMSDAIDFVLTESRRHEPKQERADPEPEPRLEYPTGYWDALAAGTLWLLMLIMIFCK